jgi:hypothetical protein
VAGSRRRVVCVRQKVGDADTEARFVNFFGNIVRRGNGRWDIVRGRDWRFGRIWRGGRGFVIGRRNNGRLAIVGWNIRWFEGFGSWRFGWVDWSRSRWVRCSDGVCWVG